MGEQCLQLQLRALRLRWGLQARDGLQTRHHPLSASRGGLQTRHQPRVKVLSLSALPPIRRVQESRVRPGEGVHGK